MANKTGTAFTAPIPHTSDPNPLFTSEFVAWAQEAKSLYLETKIGQSNIDISGVPDLLHGTRSNLLGASVWDVATGSPTHPINTAPYWAGAAGTDIVSTDIVPLEVGRQLTGVSVYGRANGVTAWSFKLWTVNMLTGVIAQVGTTITSAAAAAIELKPITSGLPLTITADTIYKIEWTAGAAANRLYGAVVTYNKVA